MTTRPEAYNGRVYAPCPKDPSSGPQPAGVPPRPRIFPLKKKIIDPGENCVHKLIGVVPFSKPNMIFPQLDFVIISMCLWYDITVRRVQHYKDILSYIPSATSRYRLDMTWRMLKGVLNPIKTTSAFSWRFVYLLISHVRQCIEGIFFLKT